MHGASALCYPLQTIAKRMDKSTKNLHALNPPTSDEDQTTLRLPHNISLSALHLEHFRVHQHGVFQTQDEDDWPRTQCSFQFALYY
jgi:hypothetical protein